MLISRRYNFLFVHIPKTAGTSIRNALAGEARRCMLPREKHASAESFVFWFGLRRFKSYRSFCVVRDPLARFLSHFAYLKSQPDRFTHMAEIGSPEDYAAAIQRGDPQIMKMRGVPSQYSFVTVGDAVVVDHILRYERLSEDFRSFCDLTGLASPALPWRNKSALPAGAASPRVCAFVREYYKRDYDLFGYARPSADGES